MFWVGGVGWTIYVWLDLSGVIYWVSGGGFTFFIVRWG